MVQFSGKNYLIIQKRVLDSFMLLENETRVRSQRLMGLSFPVNQFRFESRHTCPTSARKIIRSQDFSITREHLSSLLLIRFDCRSFFLFIMSMLKPVFIVHLFSVKVPVHVVPRLLALFAGKYKPFHIVTLSLLLHLQKLHKFRNRPFYSCG